MIGRNTTSPASKKIGKPDAATGFLGGDNGVTLLVNLPIALVAWYVGAYLVSRFLAARVFVPLPELLFGEIKGGSAPSGGASTSRAASTDNDGTSPAPAGSPSTAGTKVDKSREEHPTAPVSAPAGAPSFGLVFGLLLLPLVLISFNTVLTTLVAGKTLSEGQAWVELLQLLGNTPVALLVTLLVAIMVLGRRDRSMADVRTILDQALAPICSIILITGAGGMFGGVLRTSGIGEALTTSLSGVGLPLLPQAFLIATALRVAQGSATVALTTASGLIASQAEGLVSVQVALLVVAVAAGATVLSHLNDSGFWLVSRFFGMDEKTTLKTWTVLETTLGLSAFVLAALLWPLAGAL